MLTLFKGLFAGASATGALALFLLLAGPAAVAQNTAALGESNAALGENNGEFVMGAADAPVTVIEYFSLTCPHCADFHRDTLPKVIAEYIDTGKVRMVFRDFPLDNLALVAAAIARCMGDERFLGFVNLLYEQQDTWRGSNDPLGALSLLARLAGMNQTRFDACLNDEQVTGLILLSTQTARSKFGVQSTPTFIFNDRPVEGAITFEEWQAAVDPLLN